MQHWATWSCANLLSCSSSTTYHLQHHSLSLMALVPVWCAQEHHPEALWWVVVWMYTGLAKWSIECILSIYNHTGNVMPSQHLNICCRNRLLDSADVDVSSNFCCIGVFDAYWSLVFFITVPSWLYTAYSWYLPWWIAGQFIRSMWYSSLKINNMEGLEAEGILYEKGVLYLYVYYYYLLINLFQRFQSKL